MKPCITCGAPSTQSRCKQHRRRLVSCRACGKGTTRERGICEKCDPYRAKTYRRLEDKPLPESWCQECGRTDDLTRDHIDGDATNNAPSNFQTLCRSCNSAKQHDDKRAHGTAE